MKLRPPPSVLFSHDQLYYPLIFIIVVNWIWVKSKRFEFFIHKKNQYRCMTEWRLIEWNGLNLSSFFHSKRKWRTKNEEKSELNGRSKKRYEKSDSPSIERDSTPNWHCHRKKVALGKYYRYMNECDCSDESTFKRCRARRYAMKTLKCVAWRWITASHNRMILKFIQC